MGRTSATRRSDSPMGWTAPVICCVTILLAPACSLIWKSEPPPDEAESKTAATKTPAQEEEVTTAPEKREPPTVEEKAPPEAASAQEKPKKPAPKPESRMPPQPEGKPEAPSTAADEPSLSPETKETSAVPAATAVESKSTKREPLEEQAEPPLDLELLETRLRETKAIGLFTKLALKNQVDDLLDRFRDYYQGHSSVSLSQLRQPYEMLMMKVLALLQDDDPPLAHDILESREAIWNILSNREKFESY